MSARAILQSLKRHFAIDRFFKNTGRSIVGANTGRSRAGGLPEALLETARVLARDERTKSLPVVVDVNGPRFYAATPIVVRGQGLGTLAVLDSRPRPDGPSREQSAGLAALSARLSRLIDPR